jgi:endonuclease/exonuclease/phosphatase family metal-dependent hydrolase
VRLELVTWNVHGGIGSDSKRDPRRAFAVLEQLDADIVALQEAEGSDWESLAAAAGYEVVLGHTIPRRFGNALLARPPLVRVRRLDLSVARREPRGAIDAVVRIGDESLRIVATHLGLRSWERRRQAATLADALGTTDAELPCVVVGDLNDWTPGGRQLAALRRSVGPFSRLRTFPSQRPLLALDRAAWRVPGSAAHVSRVDAAELRGISDHLPLRLELAWHRG